MNRGMKLKRHSFLSNQECQVIHDSSCRLLEEVGVAATSEKAIDLFQKKGAVYEQGRVKIPKNMVEDALEKTAKEITLHGQHSKDNIRLNPEDPLVYYGTGGQALNVLYYHDGEFEKKSAGTQDLIDILRICENLENVDFITRPVEPDVPEEKMDLEKTRIFLENTSKHVNLANLIKLDKLPEIIEAVKDKSRISFISCVLVSPMNLVSDTVEKFMDIVKEDIAVSISSCPQGGSTAPLSEVGEIIQVNAELLSAVVLANLVRPGAKVLYRGIPITSNLYADASPRWCQPESIRRIAVITDMTYFYKIPCCGTAAVSDEKEPNPQTVAEKTLSWVFESASGAQFINSAVGMLEQVLTVSPEQYIIDNQVISRIKELFSQSPDYDLAEIAQKAVHDALNMFDVNLDSQMKQDISNRIEFILSPKEEYTPEYAGSQVDTISKAIQSGRSSNKFMKASRAGLRKGWLYKGMRLEGQMNLDEVLRIKKQILGWDR
ncbi:trimethylamine methyltransferase family protein [bacterium]|nr:trimethylamine methyltransferase family protein [bacterium]